MVTDTFVFMVPAKDADFSSSGAEDDGGGTKQFPLLRFGGIVTILDGDIGGLLEAFWMVDLRTHWLDCDGVFSKLTDNGRGREVDVEVVATSKFTEINGFRAKEKGGFICGFFCEW